MIIDHLCGAGASSDELIPSSSVRMDNDSWRRGAQVDWRRHRLRAPPRGYEWREANGRYVMAAVATGLIADIILNAH
jgi:Ni/Co efflux regulator RcnB